MIEANETVLEKINKLIGKCLVDIETATGLSLNAKINGKTVSFFPDDDHNNQIITLEDIEKAVVYVLKIENPNFLRVSDRTRDYVDGRTVFCDICTKYGFSLSSIGRFIGRDHTTVIHHVKKTRCLINADQGFTEKYVKVTNYLKMIKW